METYETEEYKGFTINWEYDTDPFESPRDWECNLSHMICWHSRYSLGDDHDYENPQDFLKHLVYDLCSYEEIEKFFVEHAAKCGLEFHEFTEEGEYDGDYKGELIVHYDSKYATDDRYEANSIEEAVSEAVDQLMDVMKNEVYIAMIEPYAVISTISMYDHSGITVWIGSPSDPWDSGYVGYIYQTKEDTIKQNGGTEENWKDVAWENMKAEMEVYDQYVRGEVFWWQILDENEEIVDSCGGYYGTDAIEEQTPECRDIIDGYIKEREVQREIAWEENIIQNCLDFTYA